MKINQYIDHTYLKPFASEQDIIETCREAKEYHFASVCVNPCNIRLAAQELGESEVKACSVIGFPLVHIQRQLSCLRQKKQSGMALKRSTWLSI